MMVSCHGVRSGASSPQVKSLIDDRALGHAVGTVAFVRYQVALPVSDAVSEHRIMPSNMPRDVLCAGSNNSLLGLKRWPRSGS